MTAKLAGQPVAAAPTSPARATSSALLPSGPAPRPVVEPENGAGRPASEERSTDRELGGERAEPDRFLSGFDLVDTSFSMDPMTRVLSASGLRLTEPASLPAAALPPFAELWGRFVRRVAWGGDGRRGSARIEIGQGEWAGARIVVHAVERQVAVEIELPAGAPLEAWRERIEGRLRERGLEVSELTIR